jgi:hypothetical protein
MSFTDAIIPTNTCYLHAETESVVHLKRQILAIEVIRWKLERTYARNKQDTLPIWCRFPKTAKVMYHSITARNKIWLCNTSNQ